MVFMVSPRRTVAMRPILSTTDTYNYTLWQSSWIRRSNLCLSANTRYPTSFNSPKRSNDLQIGDNNFLVSYDVTALFTNVAIQILVKKAFNGNWFSNTRNLNICEGDLIELFTIATKDQLFQRRLLFSIFQFPIMHSVCPPNFA